MATITEDYVSFEIAKILKEKGFDQNCATYYLDGQVWHHYHGEVIPKDKQIYAAPTQAMAMKWLREVHNIDICAFPYQADYILYSYNVKIYKDKEIYLTITDSKTYEEACEAAIKYSLENLI